MPASLAPDELALNASYDFICATEVVEHLHRPGQDLERLWSLLRPGGWMGIMTKLVRDRASFDTWHYKNDPTHVCFFSEEYLALVGAAARRPGSRSSVRMSFCCSGLLIRVSQHININRFTVVVKAELVLAEIGRYHGQQL